MSFWKKLFGVGSKPTPVIKSAVRNTTAPPVSRDAAWGRPSANNEISMALEKLAHRAWTYDSPNLSGDFLFAPPVMLINDTAVLEQALSALYKHARRWVPGLEIPFHVPRVRVVREMKSAGRFEVDGDGWTSIDLASEFTYVPKAAWLILAHEVCHHIMAQSGEDLRQDSRLNERITDVAMFVCGFGDLAKNGQTFVEATGSGYVRRHFGYLEAAEYSFVHNWVIATRCANQLPGMANTKPLYPELAVGFQIKPRKAVILERLKSRIIDAGVRERLLTHCRKNYPLDSEEELIARILDAHERDRR